MELEEPAQNSRQQLFAALRENQEQINRFFGTIAGTVRVPECFSPENMGQISGAGAVAVA